MTAPAIATKPRRTKKLSTHGTYLVRTPYSYCFRYRIPPDLHDVVGKKEIRYSLKTGYIGRAKAMSFQLAARVQNLCAELRDAIGDQTGSINIEMPKELSPERIQELIAGWVRESLKEDEQERLRPQKRLTEYKLEHKYSGYDWAQSSNREALALGRHVETMSHHVDWILNEQGITVDKDSDSYHQLCRDIIKKPPFRCLKLKNKGPTGITQVAPMTRLCPELWGFNR